MDDGDTANKRVPATSFHIAVASSTLAISSADASAAGTTSFTRPSSNASASMLWREATLMQLLGGDYPPAKYDGALFSRWDKDAFTAAAVFNFWL